MTHCNIIRFFDIFSDTSGFCAGLERDGNAVTVNVVHAIATHLKAAHTAAMAASYGRKEDA